MRTIDNGSMLMGRLVESVEKMEKKLDALGGDVKALMAKEERRSGALDAGRALFGVIAGGIGGLTSWIAAHLIQRVSP